MEAYERVRIDKWLWAARFFKIRSLATQACDLGRIECNGAGVKPSREVRAGDLLRVKNEGGDYQVEVLIVSGTRGPAEVARGLYRETDASKELRSRAAEERKVLYQADLLPEGRPSKRDRRDLERLRGRS